MLLGTLANVVAIVIGTLIGLMLKQRLPERFNSIAMQGLGLVTSLIGLKMMIITQNALIVLVSIVIGGVLGELLRIEDRLDRLGARVEARFSKERGTFAKAFVTSTLLFSTLPVAAYQGGITIGASLLEPYLTSSMINEMIATGGLLILGIALNILQ